MISFRGTIFDLRHSVHCIVPLTCFYFGCNMFLPWTLFCKLFNCRLELALARPYALPSSCFAHRSPESPNAAVSYNAKRRNWRRTKLNL